MDSYTLALTGVSIKIDERVAASSDVQPTQIQTALAEKAQCRGSSRIIPAPRRWLQSGFSS